MGVGLTPTPKRECTVEPRQAATCPAVQGSAEPVPSWKRSRRIGCSIADKRELTFPPLVRNQGRELSGRRRQPATWSAQQTVALEEQVIHKAAFPLPLGLVEIVYC